MKPGKLVMLVVVAVVLVGLAVWSSSRQQSAPPSVVGKPLLPKLDLESVARVEIARQGAPVTIARGADGWVVTNLFNYPADVTKLQGALLKLADQKIGELARGVNIDTNATLVDLQGATGKPLATVRLAARNLGGEVPGRMPSGRYASVAGDNRVYLVKDGLEEFDGEAREWVNSQLLNVPSADVQSIQMRAAPTSEVLSFSRETGSLQLSGVATNEEFDTGKAYGIESACSYLNFTGVADPKLAAAQAGLDKAGTFTLKLKNGDVYVAQVGAAAPNGDRYATFAATLAPAGTNAAANAEQAARKAELDQKFKWTYLISGSSAENMTRTRADLVKPKVVDTNATAAAKAPAP